MIQTYDPKVIEKPVARCAKCDAEVTRYNSFVKPDNGVEVVCWNCLQREEKNFFQRNGFSRRGRRGDIPR